MDKLKKTEKRVNFTTKKSKIKVRIQKNIPLYSMEKIVKDIEDVRISNDAKIILKQELEQISEEISKTAVLYSLHAKRRTVMKSDLLLALKK